MSQNSYAKYQEQSVMTMTHGEMLVKLYDGAVRQIRQASSCIEQKQFAQANDAFQKAQRIIAYLRATLDFKYEISAELDRFYQFFIEELLNANLRKDVSKLPEIVDLILELREAFEQGERIARMEKQPASPAMFQIG